MPIIAVAVGAPTAAASGSAPIIVLSWEGQATGGFQDILVSVRSSTGTAVSGAFVQLQLFAAGQWLNDPVTGTTNTSGSYLAPGHNTSFPWRALVSIGTDSYISAVLDPRI